MELIVFLGTLFLFLFLNIPIALVMILSAICLMIYSGFWDFMIIPQAIVDGVNNYPLMAIPFFVFAGEIMGKGGLSKRVVLLAQLLIGRVRGGLGYATIVASVIFAGLMGSSVGEAAALCGILFPMMKQAGYNNQQRTGGWHHRFGRDSRPDHSPVGQLHPAGCNGRTFDHQVVHDRAGAGPVDRFFPADHVVLHRPHRRIR